MTTASWSTRVRHDSDAMFREWGAEFAAQLAAVGMVQTADTGQINWTTVTRPGSNTNAGYEIWAFNDSLQGSAPIYIRIDYGTSAGTTSPRIMVTVGTGTNGSGTLSGTALTTSRTTLSNNAATSDTARVSYMCHAEGIFWFHWKVASQEACFFVARTCDSGGALTATGAMVHWGAANVSSITARQALRFASPAAAYTAQTSLIPAALGLNAQAVDPSAVGADNQAFMAWTITPRASPLNNVVGILPAEYPAGTTFTATPVGSVSHTFMALPAAAGPFSAIGSGSPGHVVPALVWE